MKKICLTLMILFCPCIVWASSSNWDSLIWDQDVWYAGKGDVNGDDLVDLKDAIIAMQVLSGISPQSTILPAADVDGNGKIGMAEAIYVMQQAAGL